MRKVWVYVNNWDKELITTALENGAHGIIIGKEYVQKVLELGKINVVAREDALFFKIKSGQDEDEIVKISANKLVFLECLDWTIIPLENLIAKKANIAACVKNIEEAKTAFGILEKGVDNILFYPNSPIDLKKALSELLKSQYITNLDIAEILEILPVGMGDRVCVDTCSLMQIGSGMLVGNSSAALFLVHAESVENPYVSPRPFRVNAGAVHAYVRVNNDKTKYLSELQAGDKVLITDFKGTTTEAIVGRIKIEKRPMMLIKALHNNNVITTILQNAETIRLTKQDGQPISVVSLKRGDKILIASEECGRHFGHKISETITEK